MISLKNLSVKLRKFWGIRLNKTYKASFSDNYMLFEIASTIVNCPRQLLTK